MTTLSATSFAALTAIFLTSTSAIAADVNGRTSTKDAPVFTDTVSGVHWTGFQLGAHAGYSWGEADVTRSVSRKAGAYNLSTCDVTPPPVKDGPDPIPAFKYGLSAEDCAAEPVKGPTAYVPAKDFSEGYPGTPVDGGRADTFYGFDDHTSKHNVDMDGWFGGLDVSYKVRRGAFIIEPFGDVSFGGGKGSASFSREVVITNEAGDEEIDTDVEHGSFSIKKRWGATAGLKAGFLLRERDYLYGLAGLAYGSYSIKGGSNLESDKVFDSAYKDTDSGFGYTVGGGYERALDRNWKLGIEGRWTEIDGIGAGSSSQRDKKHEDPNCGDTFVTSESIKADIGDFSVMGRISYTFD